MPLLKKFVGKSVCIWVGDHWSGVNLWLGMMETPIRMVLAVNAELREFILSQAVLIYEFIQGFHAFDGRDFVLYALSMEL